MELKAIVSGTASKTMTKSNGAEYVLINCEITEGPAKGKIVAGTRTTINADGIEKSIPEVGQEVVLHVTAVDSTSQPGKLVIFYEIGTNSTASHDEMADLLGLSVAAANTNQYF